MWVPKKAHAEIDAGSYKQFLLEAAKQFAISELFRYI